MPIVSIAPIKYKTMKQIIKERVEALREVMRRERLDAFIFPSTDPHNGEYVPEHWEGRKWISGFDGSAGTAVVTMDDSALWTDSRYFLAAEEQLEGTGFVLMKERMEGTPTVAKWLGMKLSVADNPQVGVDGNVNSAEVVAGLMADLRAEGGITVRTNYDPLNEIWADRPPLPKGKVVVHDMRYAGETCASKLMRLRGILRESHACGILISSLDDIAWMLNLRGCDVHCNPVFVSYLIVTDDDAILFVDGEKLTTDVVEYLSREGVRTDEYINVSEALARYGEYNIMVDAGEVNYALYNIIRCNKVNKVSPVPYMKAVKNEVEIGGFRRAMLRDGVAMVKFLYWLHPAVAEGGQTELTVSEKLRWFREQQDGYRGLSFDTIAAYQEHGAIVHYEPTEQSDVSLKKEGLILIDSGAQYVDGTTDITRTIALGSLTEEQKKVYTLVLKGHIKLQMMKFPTGASGTQIDAVARMDMWREGYNFMHGTGHGVGSYLNVHEGPHQIRMEHRPAPIVAGMTVTDEPGIYVTGKFGVRIENTLLAVPYMSTDFGNFIQFETLTLCPIDKTPILNDMLSDDERDWLNDYHACVYDKLSPYLSDTEKEWLRNATLPV